MSCLTAASPHVFNVGLRVNVAQTSSITIGDSFAYPLRKCVRLFNSSGSHQEILAAELGLYGQRITFKIALTVFDCARGRCPAYFSDICVPVHSVAGRSRLRSADHSDLIVPRVQTQRYGSRSFRVSGPTVWNSLPQNLRSSDISREQFKRGLKHGCLSVLMCRWRV